MRRARIAVLSALVGVVLVVLPLPAQAQHRAVTVAADPFDPVARHTPAGDGVYRDANNDGKIMPDRGRALGIAKAMYVTGADEVVLLDSESAKPDTTSSSGTINSPSLVRQVASPAAVMADCWRKSGLLSAEAYWWSDTGIKYTFRWSFAVDFRDWSCNGYGLNDKSRYAAGLYAKRLGDPTPAYFTNNDAVWVWLDYWWELGCPPYCQYSIASRDWGKSAYQSDGAITYLGTEHVMNGERWYYSRSSSLRATFTAPSPDHTTNVYEGCSAVTGFNGGVSSTIKAC